MTKFEIRRAALCDVKTLVALRLEMRRERETALLTIPETEFALRLEKYFSQAVSDGSFISFIAWDNDIAAGCSGLSVMALPPSYGDLTGKKGYITNMYTRTEYRGQGLARKLLDELKRYAVEVGCSSLELNASAAGYPVYKKYGFSDVANEMKLELDGQA